jgi:quinoprotein glucose dehydrogenase
MLPQKRYNPGVDARCGKVDKSTIPMIGLLIWGATFSVLQAQAPETVWDGAYTLAQAQRGETHYKQQCAACHGDALEGDGQTERAKQLNRALPPLSGDVFKGNWNGRPLSDLFDKVSKTMPRDDPGKMSRAESADVIAYMLKFNGFPAGKAELPPDPSLLTDTLFVSVKPKK